MKLQAQTFEGSNAIARHGEQGVIVGGVEYRASLVVPWRGEVAPWRPARFEDLQAADFDRLVAFGPELVVFGSGPRLRFVHPSLLRPLIERGIGLETMDTAAACRTYNVLLAEGRAVIAALLFSTQP